MNLVNNLSFLLVVAPAAGWRRRRHHGGRHHLHDVLAADKAPVNELASQFNMIRRPSPAPSASSPCSTCARARTGTLAVERAEVAARSASSTSVRLPARHARAPRLLLREARPEDRLVGETGSGKTTIINLLTRFYEPDAGRILLDGIDLRESRRSLRICMAVMLQDAHLFSGTVTQNISFGVRRPREQVVAAAQLANAAPFIERLPDGYDTRLNRRHRALQGQCQPSRRSAALADLPCSSSTKPRVDTRTEMHIQQAMVRLMKGRTSLIARPPPRRSVWAKGFVAGFVDSADRPPLAGLPQRASPLRGQPRQPCNLVLATISVYHG